MGGKKDLLYFVALLPPDEIRREVTLIKESFYEKYKTKAALKSPPHITLHMPFRWKPEKENLLHELFSSFSSQVTPFPVEINGFEAFPPRVIFLNVSENHEMASVQKDLVRRMRTNLNLLNANYKDRPFRPHMTVAFRDLKKPMFNEAWEEVKDEGASFSFEAKELTLLKNINGKWETHRQYSFNEK
ncbi:2'-5' RNA ligase family protein [Roseivirga sp. BDSF3-8]|uniref:2'-5' RNA ligase family protein n=1 Tax=Roseivirga sp. BDSF3-8 TaxID=3241598 RepID=UPI0035320073